MRQMKISRNTMQREKYVYQHTTLHNAAHMGTVFHSQIPSIKMTLTYNTTDTHPLIDISASKICRWKYCPSVTSAIKIPFASPEAITCSVASCLILGN